MKQWPISSADKRVAATIPEGVRVEKSGELLEISGLSQRQAAELSRALVNAGFSVSYTTEKS